MPPLYYGAAMNSVSGSNRLTARVILASAFLAFVAIAPSHAAAQSIASQTQQLIPPGQNTCQVVSVTNVTPHVYNGVLESFDVTISDTSNGYVGILAAVGNTAMPLNYITRWAGEPGLRIHVDTPDMTVGTGLPVSLDLLSSLPNQPTCITTISFEVTGMGITTIPATNPVSTIGQPTSNYTAPSQSTAPYTAPSTVSSTKGGSPATAGNSTKTSSSTMASASSTALGASVVSASNAKFFSNICVGSNAYKLWFILLAIYVIIVAIVVFAEPWYLESSVIGSTAAILVPLILLLGFWYFSEACRAAAWIPVAACVIAIIGLFLAFREYETPPLLPASTNS
jgi:hypothetical protein